LGHVRTLPPFLRAGRLTEVKTSDFADQFPSAEVIGTDLSPIQPSWMPPNCRFELDDASLPWTFDDNTFDYIHIRCLLGSIADWVSLYRECYRCLKPGGWLEHTDFSVLTGCDDASLPEDSVWYEWSNLFIEAGRKMGRTFEIVDNDAFVGWMKEAGFGGTVHTHKTKLPTTGWPADPKLKEVGVFNKAGVEESLEGFALYICCNVLGWEYAECQLLLARVRKAMNNRAFHSYYRW
jgi:SAM-dependent methyltransferase